MREIKFEIIIKIHNKDFTSRLERHYTTLDRLTEKTDPLDYTSVDIVAKRQFTGLKDKNGVDIYEGDIVTTYNCKHNCEITFRNACFCIKTSSGGISELYDLAPVSNQAMEVVGNIYENPELLES